MLRCSHGSEKTPICFGVGNFSGRKFRDLLGFSALDTPPDRAAAFDRSAPDNTTLALYRLLRGRKAELAQRLPLRGQVEIDGSSSVCTSRARRQAGPKGRGQKRQVFPGSLGAGGAGPLPDREKLFRRATPQAIIRGALFSLSAELHHDGLRQLTTAFVVGRFGPNTARITIGLSKGSTRPSRENGVHITGSMSFWSYAHQATIKVKREAEKNSLSPPFLNETDFRLHTHKNMDLYRIAPQILEANPLRR